MESTLTAAMLDPECAKALRSGLLVTHLSATGVGESAAGAAVALPEALGFAATSAPPSLRSHRRVPCWPCISESSVEPPPMSMFKSEPLRGVEVLRGGDPDQARFLDRGKHVDAKPGTFSHRRAKFAGIFCFANGRRGDDDDHFSAARTGDIAKAGVMTPMLCAMASGERIRCRSVPVPSRRISFSRPIIVEGSLAAASATASFNEFEPMSMAASRCVFIAEL